MPRGDKSAYTDKQTRQAEHIEEDGRWELTIAAHGSCAVFFSACRFLAQLLSWFEGSCRETKCTTETIILGRSMSLPAC
jgi:hypothetical protein